MPSVMIVDDSPLDRVRVGRILQTADSTFEIIYAENGEDALAQMIDLPPDVVLTDLQMPVMDGLQLVGAVRERFPLIPVILMTSKGSEDIAARALLQGAVSYVPKSTVAETLGETVEKTLKAALRDRMHSRLMHSLEEHRSVFSLQNDPELIELVVSYLQELLRCVPMQDESDRLRVGVALKHALLNAWWFGNLEIDPEIESREELSRLTNERSHEEPYSNRLIRIESTISNDAALFRIKHDGTPFPPSILKDSLATSDKPLYQGLILIRSAMDEVTFDDSRHEQTLLKCALQSEALEWN